MITLNLFKSRHKVNRKVGFIGVELGKNLKEQREEKGEKSYLVDSFDLKGVFQKQFIFSLRNNLT